MEKSGILESMFKFYSLGYIIRDKKANDDIVEVYPIEHLGESDTNLEDITEMKGTNTDIDGNVVQYNIKKTNMIRARWLALSDANRQSAPDVRKKETVLIYKFADADLYYWDTIFVQSDLRGKEHVLYAYGNKDDRDIAFNLDNSYWMLWSPRDKTVKLHLSDNDGEVCTYDMIFDTKRGTYTLIDGRGNYHKLDSKKDKFITKSNKEIEHITKKYRITCDDYELLAKNIITNADSVTHNHGATNYKGGTIKHDGKSIDRYHTHRQTNGNDAGGDTDTTAPNN